MGDHYRILRMKIVLPRDWPRVAYAARGANYLAVSAGVLKVRPDTKAPKKFSDIYIYIFFYIHFLCIKFIYDLKVKVNQNTCKAP